MSSNVTFLSNAIFGVRNKPALAPEAQFKADFTGYGEEEKALKTALAAFVATDKTGVRAEALRDQFITMRTVLLKHGLKLPSVQREQVLSAFFSAMTKKLLNKSMPTQARVDGGVELRAIADELKSVLSKTGRSSPILKKYGTVTEAGAPKASDRWYPLSFGQHPLYEKSGRKY